eukprot:610202-Pyramimonas_sp.AAC.1
MAVVERHVGMRPVLRGGYAEMWRQAIRKVKIGLLFLPADSVVNLQLAAPCAMGYVHKKVSYKNSYIIKQIRKLSIK